MELAVDAAVATLLVPEVSDAPAVESIEEFAVSREIKFCKLELNCVLEPSL